MERVAHLWNVTQYLSKFHCSQQNKLQAFYIQCCRKLGNEVDLPKQNFGPQVMCAHCGCLWTNVNHSIRIIRAKKLTGSLKKIVNSSKITEKRVPRVRRTLIKKCMKNQMNKLQITCSFCSLKTEIPLRKPLRPNITKCKKVDEGLQGNKKKKKKKKDKTAGIIVSRNQIPTINSQTSQSPINTDFKMKKTNSQAPKLKKLRIDKLKEIVNQVAAPKSRKSLQSFLSEIS